jgi:CIC family chloride channel protein
MVGVIISATIVRLSFGYSFSTWRFHQRGLSIHSPHDVGWIANLTVARLMRADAKVVDAEQTVASLREKYPLGSAKFLFAEDKGQFIGSIDLARLHEIKSMPDGAPQTARNVAAAPNAFLLPSQNIRIALGLFNGTQLETLPVVRSTTDRHVLGYLTEAYALRRYNQELEQRRNADFGVSELFPISEPPEAPKG